MKGNISISCKINGSMSLGLSDPKLTFFTSLQLQLGKHGTNIEKKPKIFSWWCTFICQNRSIGGFSSTFTANFFAWCESWYYFEPVKIGNIRF